IVLLVERAAFGRELARRAARLVVELLSERLARRAQAQPSHTQPKPKLAHHHAQLKRSEAHHRRRRVRSRGPTPQKSQSLGGAGAAGALGLLGVAVGGFFAGGASTFRFSGAGAAACASGLALALALVGAAVGMAADAGGG